MRRSSRSSAGILPERYRDFDLSTNNSRGQIRDQSKRIQIRDQSERIQIRDQSGRKGSNIDNNDEILESDRINIDDDNYSKELRLLIHIYVCGCCGVEESLKYMELYENVIDRVEKSDMRLLRQQLQDEAKNNHQARCRAQGIVDKVDENGILLIPGCGQLPYKYICNHCIRYFPSDNATPGEENTNEEEFDEVGEVGVDIAVTSYNVPKLCFMLIYPGDLPEELMDLWDTEVSMISKINIMSKVSVFLKYPVSSAKTFAVMNNLPRVATHLPRMLTDEDFAYLKTCNVKGKAYKYRPHKVKDALVWLSLNNVRYKDIELTWTNWSTSEEVALPHHDLGIEDSKALDEINSDNYVEGIYVKRVTYLLYYINIFNNYFG